MKREHTSMREPELDGLSHEIDRAFYWDLTPELRIEVLKVKEMRKQTAILERLAERLSKQDQA